MIRGMFENSFKEELEKENSNFYLVEFYQYFIDKFNFVLANIEDIEFAEEIQHMFYVKLKGNKNMGRISEKDYNELISLYEVPLESYVTAVKLYYERIYFYENKI